MGQMRRRKTAALIHVIAIAVCLLAVTGAGAKVIPSVSTKLANELVVPPSGPTPVTTYVSVPDTRLGAHTDYVVRMNFDYGATALTGPTGLKYPDPASNAPPSVPQESVKDVVVDSPPGLMGNPNAVPMAERCDMSTFENAVCPQSSIVGTIAIQSTVMPLTPGEGGPTAPMSLGGTYLRMMLDYRDTNGTGGYTQLSLIKTSPEVPATIGVYVRPPFGFQPIRQLLKISPDTSGQLQLRTLSNNISRLLRAGPAMANPGAPLASIRIDWQEIRFWGMLPNGHAFMTNPTSCEKWKSTIWTNSHFFNDNLDADPLGVGSPQLKFGNTDEITPDCTNAPSVPFPVTGNVAISSPNRNTSPAFDFTIANPGIQADGQVSTSPKKILTTIPASINVDVQQLGRVCPVAAFNADACPTSSRFGSVKIETPLIEAGLSGDVYLVKENSNSGLPDLGLRVRGAISFTQRGSNRYTGEKFNQIETTFNDIPQVGFSKLTFHLDGGSNGLLRSLSCPTYNKAPAVPTFTYYFTAWTGAQATSTTPLNMASCFGIQQLKKYRKCLHTILPIHPNYQSRSRVRNVVLKIDGKRKASRKHSPFRFDLPIKKLKLKNKPKHKFELKATYDDKTVSKKTATFKVCK